MRASIVLEQSNAYIRASEARSNVTPQTVMLDGIPPSIHHGGARKVSSHGIPVGSLRLVFRGFNQL